jgi:hypothetical protein
MRAEAIVHPCIGDGKFSYFIVEMLVDITQFREEAGEVEGMLKREFSWFHLVVSIREKNMFKNFVRASPAESEIGPYPIFWRWTSFFNLEWGSNGGPDFRPTSKIW